MHQVTAFLEKEITTPAVIEVSNASDIREDCVCVDLSCLRELDGCKEFQAGAMKRIGKGGNVAKLPYACLACPGYSVNHEGLQPYDYATPQHVCMESWEGELHCIPFLP